MNRIFLQFLAAGVVAAAAATPAAAQRSKQRKAPPRQKQVKTAPVKTTRQQAPTTLRRTADSLKEATVAVYQTYEPELRPVNKPQFVPANPVPDTAVVPQRYEVPQQALYYTYRALPLRPLALGRDTVAPEDADYIRIGGGNRATAYFEGATSRLHGTDWSTLIFARHLSQHSNLAAQSASNSELTATGAWRRGIATWTGKLEAARAKYGRYGFNDDLPVQNDIASRYLTFGATAGLKTDQRIGGFSYAPTIGVRAFSGPQIETERTLSAALPVTRTFDSTLSVEATLRGDFTFVGIDGKTRYNNAISFAPALLLRQGALTGRIGVTPTIDREGQFYVLPDLQMRYAIGSTGFAATAGWTGTLNRNTLEEISTRNPYLTSYRPIQSRTYEAYAGLQASFGDHLSLAARGSYWQWKSLPLFVNDFYGGDGRGFYLELEPDARGVSLQGSARYAIGEVFSAGVSAAAFSFHNLSESRLWHVPGMQFRGDLSFRPTKPLLLTAYTNVLDQIYGRNTAGTEVKLGTFVDLGFGAEYQFLPRWALWAQSANLLNAGNERFLGYPAFGRTVWGGLRVKI